ncbi:tape measure protein [Kingella oralis]|uniref:tape measure protein n=1 Tax=Kingella oralis TaxID=505 RepID=UPI0034E4F213
MAANLDFNMRFRAQTAEFSRAVAQINQELAQLRQSIGGSFGSLNTLGQGVRNLPVSQPTVLSQSIASIGLKAAASVLSVAALRKALNEVLSATRQMQSIQTRFTYAFDGLEAGKAQLEFVRQEANRLGLEMTSAANGYAQLAAAAKNLNITQEETQQVFSGVANAVAAMGLSADEANGVFLALSQIAGKGKVSMEELRQQLGERLTPAMSLAAKAMGVTTAELEKMVANGISAEKFLPKFGAAMQEAFAPTAAQNVNTLSGQINLLKNRYTEFLVAVGEGGASQAAVAIFKDIGAALDVAQAKFQEFMQSADGQQLRDGLQQVYELLKQIGGTVVEVFGMLSDTVSDAFSAMGDGEQKITLLQGALNGVAIAVASISDGVDAVKIAFNVFAAAVKNIIADLSAGLGKLTGLFAKETGDSLKAYAAELRQAADENLRQAEAQAMAFDSRLAKTLDNIAQTGRSTGEAYNQIAQGTQNATQATEQHAAALSEAEQKAQALEKSFQDAQSAASELNVDMGAATAAVGKATAGALENVQKLADGFDVLQQKGVDAALLIRQALAGSLKNAANEQDIAAIKAQYSELGKSGKLAMRDVEDGILAADMRLQELRGEIDPTAAAFKKLGVQSKEAMALSAREMKQAFERVQEAYRQGKVSAAEMNKAVEKTAQAMANSGDAQQAAWAKATAAAYGYTVVVDETGKATVEAAKKATAALNEQAQAQENASRAASQAESETAQTASKAGKSIQAATRQVSEMGKVVQNYWQQVNNPNGAYSIATSMQNTAKIMSGAWANYVQGMWRGYDQTRRAIADLNAATQSGVGIAANLAAAESLAASNADKLDKQTLDNLRAAIDDARQKMQALGEEAASTRAEIEKELLQAQGKDTAEMEQQQKLAKLRAARQTAADAGNSQAVNDYNASLAAMEQIYRLKKQKQQEQEAEKAAQPEKVEIKLPDAPKIDVGNIDLSGISSQLGERDKAIVEQVKTALVAELQKQLAAQR